MLPFVKVLVHKAHFSQGWATYSYGGRNPSASSFLPRRQPLSPALVGLARSSASVF